MLLLTFQSQGPLERHIVYQGKVCDYDFCGDNCGIDDLKVNEFYQEKIQLEKSSIAFTFL